MSADLDALCDAAYQALWKCLNAVLEEQKRGGATNLLEDMAYGVYESLQALVRAQKAHVEAQAKALDPTG